MNPVELLIKDGIAFNQFQAAHLANGLKLYELNTEEEMLKRARLYRDWRNSKIFGKDTKACYEKAIAGEPLPQQPLFDEALHTIPLEEELRKLK